MQVSQAFPGGKYETLNPENEAQVSIWNPKTLIWRP
jgi:hypothetical protein